jgi:hypothetical protein
VLLRSYLTCQAYLTSLPASRSNNRGDRLHLLRRILQDCVQVALYSTTRTSALSCSVVGCDRHLEELAAPPLGAPPFPRGWVLDCDGLSCHRSKEAWWHCCSVPHLPFPSYDLFAVLLRPEVNISCVLCTDADTDQYSVPQAFGHLPPSLYICGRDLTICRECCMVGL